jgi:multidrug efflux pump
VGSIRIFGSQYAMRIWLDPHKLNSYQLTPVDVKAAIAAQNRQVAVGDLGGTPSTAGQQINASMMAQTKMSSAEEFAQILLKVNSDGSQIRLKDVARVEIGGESYDSVTTFNGKPASGMAIMLATGANALDTAEAVRAKLADLKPYFPAGIEVVYPYDTTTFIKISIEEVAHTLVEAVILVFLVMFLFLQNFRATLIPTIAVPVVLLGTFGIMAAFGFSINTLTMFGLVLAIGLLVDDAIVVVENVERIMSEEGLSPLEATRKSMDQITGALIGIALVLSAVFVPMAFFGGSTGAIYRQFSLTIVSAMVLSVLVALILTPALCATLLKPVEGRAWPENAAFSAGSTGRFNAQRRRLSRQRQLCAEAHRPLRPALSPAHRWYGLLFTTLPTSFMPEEDQGVFLTMVQLPTGATQERTQEVLNRVRDHFMERRRRTSSRPLPWPVSALPAPGRTWAWSLLSCATGASGSGPQQSVTAVIGRAMGSFAQIKEAQVFAFNLPAIRGLGNSTGFNFFLQDRGGLGHEN